MKICAPKELSHEAQGEKPDAGGAKWMRGGKGTNSSEEAEHRCLNLDSSTDTYKEPEALWQNTLEEESGVG